MQQGIYVCYNMDNGILLVGCICFMLKHFFSLWVWKLVMSFQDVAFLPFRACFSTTFLEKSRGESLGTTTCLKTVVDGEQGYVCSTKPLFCVSRISWRS